MRIESLRVENFRSFRSLELHGLRRINVIVGNNASGKTVLLESVKLGLGANPTVIPFLNQLRGIQMLFHQNPTADQFESYFIDLFHGFDPTKEILISTVDSTRRNSELHVFFDPEQAVTIQQPALGFQPTPTGPVPPSTIVPLAFERLNFDGAKSTFYATTNQGAVLLQPGPELGITSGFFSGSYFGIPLENATWLSKLSVEKRSKEVIESIQRHFPFIGDVTSEMVIPGVGGVYVDLPYLPRKLPLSLVSGGISRLFTLMLAILTFQGGIVLVDELENGMFHGQFSLAWKTLTELARHHETQLFISTHSKECLRSALETIAEHRDDFTLLRTTKNDSESQVEVFSGSQLEAALEKDGEVRD